MSEPTPRPGAAPTRQQLDELEALMERMLALPINPLEEEVSGQMPLIVPDAVTPTAPGSPAAFDHELPLWAAPRLQPAASDSVPASAGNRETPAAAARETPVAATLPMVRSAVAEPIVVRPLPWWVNPIVRVNRLYDAWTMPFGQTGRWLRARQGRSLLGAVGIVFLAAALGLAFLAFMGWTW